MKASAVLFFFLYTLVGHAQTTINSYKYVIVPVKFDFSKIVNQYGVNTTTRQLLEQRGFVVFFDGDTLPPAVIANKCNALTADVTERTTMFTTNLTLLLKDCQGNIIYKSKEGKSREKEFYAAYNGALRDAFTSLNAMAYKYDSTAQPQPRQQVAAAPPVTASPTVQAPVATAPAPAAKPIVAAGTNMLYAQATPTGYQLVDTTPKKVLTLLKTSVQDYFIAQAETGSGIVFKRNGEWFYEYYEGDKLVSRKLEIKF